MVSEGCGFLPLDIIASISFMVLSVMDSWYMYQKAMAGTPKRGSTQPSLELPGLGAAGNMRTAGDQYWDVMMCNGIVSVGMPPETGRTQLRLQLPGLGAGGKFTKRSGG